VELHPEHRVRERLDDLAFELDLLFLRQIQMTRTFVACGPFADSPSSYSTFAPSASVRKPSPAIPEKWTNASFPPSSGVMKPKPFSSLNHFTTPVAIAALLSIQHARGVLRTDIPHTNHSYTATVAARRRKFYQSGEPVDRDVHCPFPPGACAPPPGEPVVGGGSGW